MCDLIEHCEIDALDLEDSKAAHRIVFFPHIKTKVPQVPQMGHQWGTKRDPNTFLNILGIIQRLLDTSRNF